MHKNKGMITAFSMHSGSGSIEAIGGKQYSFSKGDFIGSTSPAKLYSNVEFDSSEEGKALKAFNCRVMADSEVNTFIIPKDVHICSGLKAEGWEILDVFNHEISSAASKISRGDISITLDYRYAFIKQNIALKALKLNSNAILNFRYSAGGIGVIGKGIPAIIGLRSVLGTNLSHKEMTYANTKPNVNSENKKIDNNNYRVILAIMLFCLFSSIILHFTNPGKVMDGLFVVFFFLIPTILSTHTVLFDRKWIRPLEANYRACKLNSNRNLRARVFPVSIEYFIRNPDKTYRSQDEILKAREIKAKNTQAYVDTDISTARQKMQSNARKYRVAIAVFLFITIPVTLLYNVFWG